MNAPSTDALEAARLVDRLERLARLDATPDPLNAAQWEALRYLARANRYSRTPAAVADYLASTRGTVSRTLAALEDKGYLQREDNPRDGRSVDFALTARGRKAAQRDPLLAMAADMDASLGADVARLRRLLQRSLHGSIARNGGRAFGACLDCRHFLRQANPGAPAPHHCGLLDVALSDAESRLLCVEQEPLAA